jgi:kynurenine formamidase
MGVPVGASLPDGPPGGTHRHWQMELATCAPANDLKLWRARVTLIPDEKREVIMAGQQGAVAEEGIGHPTYEELPLIGQTGERCSWDYFGPSDEFGCLNFITPSCRTRAAAAVRDGQTLSLSLPLNEPARQYWNGRKPYEHHIYTTMTGGRDDWLDDFHLQGSSQWDGFRHIKYKGLGFYGGRQDADIASSTDLGIQAWAETGIVGRGLLIDVPSYMESHSPGYDVNSRFAVGAGLLQDILDEQGEPVIPGDILAVRTGWLEWYLEQDEEKLDTLQQRFSEDRSAMAMIGLDPSRETAAWLWNHRISAIVFDTPMLEVLPYRREEGWAHRRIFCLLGLPFGELWRLGALARACTERGSRAFMLCSAPLFIPGGVGSPANALAIL